MIAKFDETEQFAIEYLRQASDVAQQIQLSERYQKRAAASLMISNDPVLATPDNAYGMKAWAIILSVDLRKSSLTR